MKQLTGLPINYLITVNFNGFIADRRPRRRRVDRRRPPLLQPNVGTAATNFSNINLRPGYQRLKGRDALAYVRYRHTDSDLYRLARQQQFVKALKQQISSNFSVFKALKVVGAITHNVEIGQAGGGSLENTIHRYALFAYGLPSRALLPGEDRRPRRGRTSCHASPAAIQAAVQDFQTPDVEAPRNAAAVSFGRKAAGVKSLPPSHISISVLNGNGVTGSASTAVVRARRSAATRSSYAGERRRLQRAELQVLPHDGLLRPAAGGRAARGAEGRRPLRRRRREAAAGGGAREGAAARW